MIVTAFMVINSVFFGDEFKRWMAFIKSVLDWVIATDQWFDIFHCHDHHMGLIPFFIRHCPEYAKLKGIPTVFTIHNGRYQGIYSWKEFHLLPYFPPESGGLIEWNNQINSLASGIKNCWKFTTVSPSYLDELKYDSDGLEWLFQTEANKSQGILNGIDNEQWNPKQDARIDYQLKKSLAHFKKNNKSALLYELNSTNQNPIVAFIGRLVYEKGVDFLIELINNYLTYHKHKSLHFVLLGTGDHNFESGFHYLQSLFPNDVTAILKYDETLAHKIYAGSDYLIMPSRVEPCGLNQFYALRYGSIPIVRRIGGLNDSIQDFGDDGNGICFDNLTLHDGIHALNRAYDLFQDRKQFNKIRNKIVEEDNSWDASAEKYLNIYHALIDQDEE